MTSQAVTWEDAAQQAFEAYPSGARVRTGPRRGELHSLAAWDEREEASAAEARAETMARIAALNAQFAALDAKGGLDMLYALMGGRDDVAAHDDEWPYRTWAKGELLAFWRAVLGEWARAIWDTARELAGYPEMKIQVEWRGETPFPSYGAALAAWADGCPQLGAGPMRAVLAEDTDEATAARRKLRRGLDYFSSSPSRSAGGDARGRGRVDTWIDLDKAVTRAWALTGHVPWQRLDVLRRLDVGEWERVGRRHRLGAATKGDERGGRQSKVTRALLEDVLAAEVGTEPPKAAGPEALAEWRRQRRAFVRQIADLRRNIRHEFERRGLTPTR
jgi:hypothetical protein